MQLISQSSEELPQAAKTVNIFAWFGALGVLIVFLFLASYDGGYFSTTFYPAAIGSLALVGLIILAQWDDFKIPSASGTPVLALFAVTFWTGISAIWSIAPNLSLQEFARVSIYLASFIAVLSGLRTRQSVKTTTGFLTGAIVALAVFALLARMIPAYSEEFVYAGGRVMGSIGYWNGLAALMVMGIIPALWLASSPKSPRILRVAATCGLTVMGLTLYLTLSRGGLAVCLAAIGLYLVLAPDRLASLLSLGCSAIPGGLVAWYAAAKLPSLQASGDGIPIDASEGKRFAVALAIALVAGAGLRAIALLLPSRVPRSRNGYIFVLSFWVIVFLLTAGVLVSQRTLIVDKYNEMRSRSQTLAWQYDQSGVDARGPERLASTADNRTEFWRIGLRNFDEHPLLGTGAGTYRFPNMRLQSGEGLARDPHSIWIRFLSDQGVTGFLLLLALVGSLCVGVVNQIIRRPWLRRDSLYLALIIAAAVWLADTSFEWNWALPAVTVPFFILMGLAFRLGISEAEDPEDDKRLRHRQSDEDIYLAPVWVRMAALGVAMLIAFAFLGLLASAMLSNNARDDLAFGDVESASSEASRAHRLNPMAIEPAVLLAQTKVAEGNYTDAESLVLTAIDHEPESSTLRATLARLEFYDLKKTDDGLNDLTLAIDLDPQNDQLHILLHRMLNDAAIYEQTGNMPVLSDILGE